VECRKYYQRIPYFNVRTEAVIPTTNGDISKWPRTGEGEPPKKSVTTPPNSQFIRADCTHKRMEWLICKNTDHPSMARIQTRCLSKARRTHYRRANKLIHGVFTNDLPPKSMSTESAFLVHFTYEKIVERVGICVYNIPSLSGDPCNEMVLIHPTGTKLADKNRRRLNT
jgi:hypothetical protein